MKAPQKELRFNPGLEFRLQQDQDGSRKLTGYAAVFNTLSYDLGNFKERIAPGAFARSINSNADVVALSDHDRNYGVLGRTKSGTLRLSEDHIGLRFECDLPNTTLGNDTATSVSRGDIDSCSFAFRAAKATWDDTKTGPIRTLNDVDLVDITVLSVMPAYPGTSVQLRSLMFPDGQIEVPAPIETRDDTPTDADDPNIVDETEDGCNCQCESCLAGNCATCSDCSDPDNCDDGEVRSNQLLAELLAHRLI